jgi:hypothetical protein
METKYARRVAIALCKANRMAGIPYGCEDFDEAGACTLTIDQRADNILREKRFGAYVVEGNPNGWGDGDLCTIYMEPHGGEEDCIMPLDYYGDGFEVAERASTLLGDLYIEFYNAAVACVYHA